jgi:putative transcriptional regulator
MSARDLFAELMQGVEDMAGQREGAVMLCDATFGDIPVPGTQEEDIAGIEIEQVSERFTS